MTTLYFSNMIILMKENLNFGVVRLNFTDSITLRIFNLVKT